MGFDEIPPDIEHKHNIPGVGLTDLTLSAGIMTFDEDIHKLLIEGVAINVQAYPTLLTLHLICLITWMVSNYQQKGFPAYKLAQCAT